MPKTLRKNKMQELYVRTQGPSGRLRTGCWGRGDYPSNHRRPYILRPIKSPSRGLTPAKGTGKGPGCHRRQLRGPRRKRLRSNGRCSASRTPTVTSSGLSPRAAAAAATGYAASVTVFLLLTAAKLGAAERAELCHAGSVPLPRPRRPTGVHPRPSP